MLEKEIEKVFVSQIKSLGGRAYKFVSPGNDGVPDRLTILPDGNVVFVELKTDTGVLTALQKIQLERLRDLGQSVRVLHGVSEVADFFEEFGYQETAERVRRKK